MAKVWQKLLNFNCSRENRMKHSNLAASLDVYVATRKSQREKEPAKSSVSLPSQLERQLQSSGIIFRHSPHQSDAPYQMTLPITLKSLNDCLPESDRVRDGEQLYFPPVPVMEYLNSRDCNAAQILIEEKKRKLVVSCTHFGHALAFLRFYAQHFEKSS